MATWDIGDIVMCTEFKLMFAWCNYSTCRVLFRLWSNNFRLKCQQA